MKTYGELLKALIEHYEKAVIELPEDYGKMQVYLSDNNVARGICALAIYSYNINIYSSKFIDNYTNDKMNYCDYPRSHNYIIAKELLQKRIDRMKELLTEWENILIN